MRGRQGADTARAMCVSSSVRLEDIVWSRRRLRYLVLSLPCPGHRANSLALVAEVAAGCGMSGGGFVASRRLGGAVSM